MYKVIAAILFKISRTKEKYSLCTVIFNFPRLKIKLGYLFCENWIELLKKKKSSRNVDIAGDRPKDKTLVKQEICQ